MSDASTFREDVDGPPYTISDLRRWPSLAEPRDVLAVDARGRIRHLGPRHELGKGDGPTVSGHGAVLLPGFIDPHVHVRASASARASTDISGARRTDQILETVRQQAHVGDGWISLWGLQPEILDDPPPTAAELDLAAGGRPVRIRHRSTHAWVFSMAALQRFGIADRAGDSGLVIERGPDGQPTGAVVDHSGEIGNIVGRVTPPHELAREVRAWSRDLARQGIVAIVDATARNGRTELQQLADWALDGTILQRVGAMAGPDVRSAPPPVRFSGHKLMPPFTDDLQAQLVRSWAWGTPVAVHCVEVDELAAVIEAVEAVPDRQRGLLRIEHASRCPEEWVERIGRLGAKIVTHPGFVHAHGDRYLADVELAPHEWLYRLQSWREAGVPLAFASDAPAGPTSPLLEIRCATQRRTLAGAILGESEAMSASAAVECTTSSAAALAGLAEEGFGTLHVGGPAHAVLVQLGPTGIDDPSSRVMATLIDGRVIA